MVLMLGKFKMHSTFNVTYHKTLNKETCFLQMPTIVIVANVMKSIEQCINLTRFHETRFVTYRNSTIAKTKTFKM